MANIKNVTGYIRPGAYTTVESVAGTTTLAGYRIPAIIGTGIREEVLVRDAIGPEKVWSSDAGAYVWEGNDGSVWYTDYDGYAEEHEADGWHFQLSVYPVMKGTFKLYHNEVEMEDGMWTLDYDTGELVVGDPGPPGGYFTEYPDDGYDEDFIGGHLRAHDTLTCVYAAEEDYNEPRLYFKFQEKALQTRHGGIGGEGWNMNTLSLGAHLAFLNGAPAVYAVQGKKQRAARTEVIVTATHDAGDEDGTQFPLCRDGYDFDSTDPGFDPYNYIPAGGTSERTGTTLSQVGPEQYEYIWTQDAALGAPWVCKVGGSTGEWWVERIPEQLDSDPWDYEIVVPDPDVKPYDYYIHLNPLLHSLDVDDKIKVHFVTANESLILDSTWEQAFSALERVFAYFIIPLPVDHFSQVFANGKAHVLKCSRTENRKERILLIGMPSVDWSDAGVIVPQPIRNPYTHELVTRSGNIVTAFDAVMGLEKIALWDKYMPEDVQGDDYGEDMDDQEDWNINNYLALETSPTTGWFGDTYRVMFFMPDTVYVTIGDSAVPVDGFFMAAAAAGWMTSNPIQLPLTRKSLVGFDIKQDRKYTEEQIRMMVPNGITVVEPLASGGRVVHGVTTTNSKIPEQEEPSIIGQQDYVAWQVRTALENTYVGTVIDETTVTSIAARTKGILLGLQKQRVITAFRGIVVEQDTVEPRQVNVYFQIQPAYPLNWINIEFQIGLISPF